MEEDGKNLDELAHCKDPIKEGLAKAHERDLEAQRMGFNSDLHRLIAACNKTMIGSEEATGGEFVRSRKDVNSQPRPKDEKSQGDSSSYPEGLPKEAHEGSTADATGGFEDDELLDPIDDWRTYVG